MLGSLIGVVTDVAKAALAPVEIAADVARTVTKPAADMATEAVEGVRDMTRETDPGF